MILEKDKTHQQFRLSKCQPAEFWEVLQAGLPFLWRCLFSGSNWGWTSCWPIMITSIHGSTRISTFQRWLNLRSRTKAGTSRFSRLAWWARKATTSMNLGRSGYHKCFNFLLTYFLVFQVCLSRVISGTGNKENNSQTKVVKDQTSKNRNCPEKESSSRFYTKR